MTVRWVVVGLQRHHSVTNVPVVPPVYHELKFVPAIIAVSTARVTWLEPVAM